MTDEKTKNAIERCKSTLLYTAPEEWDWKIASYRTLAADVATFDEKIASFKKEAWGDKA